MAKSEVAKQKKKVLIVEDDQWVLKILVHLLQQWDFEVFSTKDPAESVDLALKHNPDIILLDLIFLNAPDITGMLLLSIFRSTEITKNIPVIIVSGNLNKDNFKKLVKGGANAFIAKPFSEKIVLQKIAEVLDDFIDMEEYLKKKASQIDVNNYG